MGRYYNGDIEGKFWFAVQSSDDASFFGGQECEPNYIDYQFEKTDMKDIKKGLAECKKELGVFKKKIDLFFKDRIAYNNKELADFLKVSEEQALKLLTWYARLELGMKIYKCVKENGDCGFQAEL
jgi:hypothetical protein